MSHSKTANGPLKVADVCRELNCEREAVYGLLESGLLRGFYLNPLAKRREWRIDPDDLAQYKRDAKAASVAQPKRTHRRRVTAGYTRYID
ncbi:MAG: helix-turn-helix domain-containing protein [Planctomycetota bacterium]